MPELPEVETVRRGILPLVSGKTISAVVVREPRLRVPVPAELSALIRGETILSVERRAKYLLLRGERGTLIVHLGMSGTLQLVPAATPPQKHDHVDLIMDDGNALRFRDPRRFGAIWWTPGDPLRHPLLLDLGPEPLSADFTGGYLHASTAGRRTAIKSLIMNQKIVVGIGNIYASEALFHAGIAPQRPAAGLSFADCGRLVHAARVVLEAAIMAGGTTLRDFQGATGKPGYFSIELDVYGRGGEECRRCHSIIRCERIGQRSTFFCPHCQR